MKTDYKTGDRVLILHDNDVLLVTITAWLPVTTGVFRVRADGKYPSFWVEKRSLIRAAGELENALFGS